MRLSGRRRSDNFEDRRSSGVSGKAIGGGIAGVVIIAIITLLNGGGISDIFSNIMSQGGLQSGQASQTEYVADAEDERLQDLALKVLAGTEDVWQQIFKEQGWGGYEAPTLVLFHGAVQSGCGNATSQTGPFYCSADQKVYIDLDFFKEMQQSIGAGGDFAYAYVIAHEVGHHVQYLLGTLSNAHSKMSGLPEKDANKISVRLELQADFYAGVWANRDNKMFNSLEPGDIDLAINTASKIGDDYLQRKAYGREIPDAFNHGTSSQRARWLKKGLDTGDPAYGDTFSPAYTSL